MIHRGFSVPANVRLPTPSSHSQIRRRVVLHQNSYDRFRLGAAGQIIELRQAENDPLQSFGMDGDGGQDSRRDSAIQKTRCDAQKLSYWCQPEGKCSWHRRSHIWSVTRKA